MTDYPDDVWDRIYQEASDRSSGEFFRIADFLETWAPVVKFAFDAGTKNIQA